MTPSARTFRTTVCAALLCTASALALAQDAMPLPAPKESGGVTWVSGGVPDEQLAAVKAARASYPLVVELFQNNGNKNQYTANARVRLIDAKGQVVLDEASEGPFFLVKPAPGTYRVEATYEGSTKTQQGVTVGTGGSRRVVFVFPPAAKTPS
jgi:hypothetical protein